MSAGRRLLITVVAAIMIVMAGIGGLGAARAETKQANDGATATAPDEVVVNTSFVITGTGWKAPSAVGSVIAVKLDEGGVSTKATLINPADAKEITNKTVYGVVQATSDGSFSIEVPFPTTTNSSATWKAGEEHSAQLLTGSLLPGDEVRTLKLSFKVVAVASSPTPTPTSASPSPSSSQSPSPTATPTPTPTTPAGCGAATASVKLSADKTVQDLPASTVGGTVKLTGEGFCHPKGGGSVIAIKINDGAYSRLDTKIHVNKTIWQIVDAKSDGSLDLDVTLPKANETDPKFGPGSYTLRLLTGSLKEGDLIRTLQTGEFVVTTGSSDTLPKPASPPDPVDPVKALVSSSRGGASATQRGAKVTFTVPKAAEGDWVYPYVFGKETIAEFNETTYEPFVTDWVQLDAKQTATVDLAAHDVDGTIAWRMSVQDRQGAVIGWVGVSKFGSSADNDDDDDFSSTDSTSSSEDLADTGGSRPGVLVLGVMLILIGVAVLRRDLARVGPGRNIS